MRGRKMEALMDIRKMSGKGRIKEVKLSLQMGFTQL